MESQSCLWLCRRHVPSCSNLYLLQTTAAGVLLLLKTFKSQKWGVMLNRIVPWRDPVPVKQALEPLHFQPLTVEPLISPINFHMLSDCGAQPLEVF
jgi:hypothetical protein